MSGAKDFLIGLDLGQAQDYTAAAVVERVQAAEVKTEETGANETEMEEHSRPKRAYHLRHLERFDLGTPYPEQAGRVAALMRKPPLRGRSHLVVDQTGVGRAVVDLLRDADATPLTGITMTSGMSVTEAGPEELRVPKKDLATRTQALFQTGRLRFAEGLPLGGTLRKELSGFQVKISAATGHLRVEHRSGEHDDLVLALCMACWYGEDGPVPPEAFVVFGSPDPSWIL